MLLKLLYQQVIKSTLTNSLHLNLIFFQFYQCPYCNYNGRDPNRIQMHVLSQHSMQPVICCPLCQDVLSNKMHLQLHLTHLHSVSPDCVEKLLMTVSAPNTDAHATQTYLGLGDNVCVVT